MKPVNNTTIGASLENNGEPPTHIERGDLMDAHHSAWFNQTTQELAPDFPITAADVVLDVKCGTGAASLFAARAGAQVTFIDAQPSHVAQVAQHMQQEKLSHVHGMVGEVYALDVPDGHASKIIALNIFERIDAQPHEVMQELVRVGQSGALYLLSVPDARGELMQKAVVPASHHEPADQTIFDREAFAQLVSDAGLEIVSHRFYGFYQTLWMLFYGATLGRANPDTMPNDSQTATHPLLKQWADTWQLFLKHPRAGELKPNLDALLPKNQVIVARKVKQNPLNTSSTQNHSAVKRFYQFIVQRIKAQK